MTEIKASDLSEQTKHRIVKFVQTYGLFDMETARQAYIDDREGCVDFVLDEGVASLTTLGNVIAGVNPPHTLIQSYPGDFDFAFARSDDWANLGAVKIAEDKEVAKLLKRKNANFRV